MRLQHFFKSVLRGCDAVKLAEALGEIGGGFKTGLVADLGYSFTLS